MHALPRSGNWWLYQRGWDKQRIIDLFLVLDWMMRLPGHLKLALCQNIEKLEEQEKMRYVSSVEQIGIEKGMQQGIQQGMQQGVLQGRLEGKQEGKQEGRQEGRQEGEALSLRRLLTKRFGELPAQISSRIIEASPAQIEQWLDRIFDAKNMDDIFSDTTMH